MNTVPVGAPELDACWQRIGVAGDRSCGELARHVHCRNCGVYAGAAQRNLQRPVEASYRDDWARELARVEPPAVPVDASALAFRIGAEWLAVPLALAVSVAPLAPIHRLPHRGGALLGVVNVDGRLLPAVALAPLLGIRTTAATVPEGRQAFPRLLVLAAGGQSYALPVDEVRGVVRHAQGALRPPAAGVEAAGGVLVAGVLADGDFEAGLLAADLLGARLAEVLR